MQNKEIEVKSEALKLQEPHLKLAAEQRNDYNNRCEKSQHNLKIKKIDTSTGIKTANSVKLSFTHSFDFAQLLHYQYNPDQPGSIFFKVPPRKCSLFASAMKLSITKQATL